MTVMRLQRVLARAGVTSRRKAEDLIRAGRVRVDGAVATLGTSVDPERQRVSVDGRHVRPAAAVWFALNKPIGVVVSRGDPDQRRTVFELVPDMPGLIYVGRLDVMTSGLLRLTTDGTAAHRLMHPRYAVHRTYRLAVHGGNADAVRRALASRPVVDGRPVAIVSASVRAKGKSVEVELTLAEGRHRIVRRLAEALNLKIEWLHRVSYGPVRLGDLAEGRSRPLTRREIEAIERLPGAAS
jgi:23S rRNA pseudouridine2605 synthase